MNDTEVFVEQSLALPGSANYSYTIKWGPRISSGL